MARALVISGFPGVGKTSLEHYERVVDLESSAFHWFWTEGRMTEPDRLPPPVYHLHPSWPKNYVDEIDKLSKASNQKIILISTQPEVRKLLQERGIPYIIVCPVKDCKNEYMIRYLRRGSDFEFIDTMFSKFYSYLDDLAHDHAPKIYLARGQYLQDVLPPL